MSTRRSTRARVLRGADSDNSSDAKSQNQSPSPRPTKRSRTNAPVNAAVRVDTATNEPLKWLYQKLPDDQRAAWDAVLKTHFSLHKPSDVYDVIELGFHLNPQTPLDAFVATAGVRLCGPFELLARSGSLVYPTKPLGLHGRFFLDPPEVVAVLEDCESSSGAHWGLYRDKPTESPSYIVYMADASDCAFEVVAVSLFSALRDRLQARLSDSNGSADRTGVEAQLRLIDEYISRKGEAYTKSAAAIRSQRSAETLASSLHGLGIVVPYDAKKRSGFRELPIVGLDLRDLLACVQSGDASAKKKLTNLLTRATIANDECDFGTSLLLGLDLFTAGSALQKESLQMLRVAYMLLGRKEFAKVASDHVKHRVPGFAPLDCLASTTTTDESGATSSLALP